MTHDTAVTILRAALIHCFEHFGKVIEAVPLNESASNGVQQLSREVARVLDLTKIITADDGANAITNERIRQIIAEGFDREHDDKHDYGQLIAAAICYASVPLLRMTYKGHVAEHEVTEMMATKWPWEEEWWKPDNDAVRNLAKAGALIAAEIDRLKRL